MRIEDITPDLVKKAITSLGGTVRTGEYNLNFAGFRTKSRIVNNWDDFFCILYERDGKEVMFTTSNYTTDPGIYYMQKKLLNPLGCGIMAQGHYPKLWKEGIHAGKYKAFIQVSPVSVYRDRNKDNYMDMDVSTLQTGNYGANLHHGYSSSKVNNNSALCQVLRYPVDLESVQKLYDKYKVVYGEHIDYTLVHEESLL